MNNLKTNVIYLLIIALLVVILWETCKSRNRTETVVSTSDTTTQIHYVYYRDSTKSKPVFLRGRRDTVFENSIEYLPSEDYGELANQFQELKEVLLSRNVFLDSLYLDSLGWVKITDTVQKNAILARKYTKNIKIPTKTVTVTNVVEAPKRRQLYIGGSVFATPFAKLDNNMFGDNTQTVISNINGGLMYKDRKDRMFGAQVQWDGRNINYGVSSYIKLSLRNNK